MIIAIDGHSSCGKSTLARKLSAHLGLPYIDSGAMYRAVTLYCLENGIDTDDPNAVEATLEHIEIEIKRNPQGGLETWLNGENVEQRIRTMEISKRVSQVSTVGAVRQLLVKQQRQFGAKHGVVMDGRDIGTVVYPDADVKIFLTATAETRAYRRYHELKRKGIDVAMEDVRKNLQERDRLDSTRDISPLRQAEDAVVLDNSDLNETQTLEKALAIVESAKHA